MRALVFEDDPDKFECLAAALKSHGLDESDIVRVRNLGEFFSASARRFDFCIIDIKMPFVFGGEPRDSAAEILRMLDEAQAFHLPVMAITAFYDEVTAHVQDFASRGCVVFNYLDRAAWTSALGLLISRARDRNRYSFVIIVALEVEQRAYAQISGLDFELVNRLGLEFWETKLGGHRGAVVRLPRMGLVQAAIVTSRVLENYSPQIVCMSGICAGVGPAQMGQLLVTDMCWEYQSGKWIEDGFRQEPYQVEVSEQLRAELDLTLGSPKLLGSIEEGYDGEFRPAKRSRPRMAIFASGSAVIASEARLAEVKEQHRKVSGIDMELYAFHRAVKSCLPDTRHFSAKGVVDLASSTKSDELHEYCSYISARFCLAFISRNLPV